MSFLFIISNITIPLILLNYRSITNRLKENRIGYGQGFVLIIYFFFSNILFYLFSESFLWLISDFAIKLGIAFMPATLNQKLEKKISHMHLEILFEKIRSNLIEWFYQFHSAITEWAITRMDQVEQKQFKNAIIDQLQTKMSGTTKQGKSGLAAKLQSSYKHYETKEVSCRILTSEMLENAEKQLSKEKQKLKSYLSDYTNKPKKEGSSLEMMIGESPSVQEANMKKKGSFLLQKSNSNFLEDFEERKPIGSSLDLPERDSKKEQEKNGKALASELKQSKSDSSLILKKLDISQYSDMFDEEQEGAHGHDKKPICKVEAIIEIGHSSTIRLQIYNIELYNNDDIRIVSLYGRQFERHKIVSMKVQKHGYYELQLKEGKVEKRKVKFRGNMEPFKKYLIDS